MTWIGLIAKHGTQPFYRGLGFSEMPGAIAHAENKRNHVMMRPAAVKAGQGICLIYEIIAANARRLSCAEAFF